MSKVIISCAVTGSVHTPTMSDALPVTPQEITASSLAAAQAGAAIIHLHARSPADGAPTGNPTVYAQFLPQIRQGCDAVINITTGGSATMTVKDRLAAAVRFRPEMCSLNMGTINFSFFAAGKRITDWKYPWEQKNYIANSDDYIFRNTFRDIAYIVQSLSDAGTKCEHECYDLGHLYNLAHGDILIANFGTDRLELMERSGATRVVLDSIDGRPLGKVNFVLRDSQDRLWSTVSTQVNPWSNAANSTLADGRIMLLDHKGPRIVADGIRFANEVRLDAREEWLYVAETTGKRVTRFRVQADGSLNDREIYGPSSLGSGLIDGIAFDAYGNLWATMIFADRLVAITPEGDLLELLDDGNAEATARFEAAFATGRTVPFELMLQCGGSICNWMASVTFGGPDLSTVYLGGLRSTSIPFFRSPVAGLPMVHWSYQP